MPDRTSQLTGIYPSKRRSGRPKWIRLSAGVVTIVSMGWFLVIIAVVNHHNSNQISHERYYIISDPNHSIMQEVQDENQLFLQQSDINNKYSNEKHTKEKNQILKTNDSQKTAGLVERVDFLQENTKNWIIEDETEPALPIPNITTLAGGGWTTWPECRCKVAPGIECGPELKPPDVPVKTPGNGGSCSWRAWAAGQVRVISVSLYGGNPAYKKWLQSFINNTKQSYPGWVVWVYTRPSPDVICPLIEQFPNHVFICDQRVIPSLGDLRRTIPQMWRVMPLGDPQVNALLVRNIHNVLTTREVDAVAAWQSSNKSWNILRDHPLQVQKINAGLWGAKWTHDRAYLFIALKNVILNKVHSWLNNGAGHQILEDVLWPVMQGDVMQHDSYSCESFNDTFPWPTQRKGDQFVGQSLIKNNKRITEPCPIKCRPPDHQDWKYC